MIRAGHERRRRKCAWRGKCEGRRNRSVQIWNNRLVYGTGSSAVRSSVPDYARSLDPAKLKYPEKPMANDVLVDTAPCATEVYASARFLSSPDGRLIYSCYGKVWYEGGVQVYDGKFRFTSRAYLPALEGTAASPSVRLTRQKIVVDDS
jgi:hypothetical protein